MLRRVVLAEVQPSDPASAKAFVTLQCRGGRRLESELKQQNQILLRDELAEQLHDVADQSVSSEHQRPPSPKSQENQIDLPVFRSGHWKGM